MIVETSRARAVVGALLVLLSGCGGADTLGGIGRLAAPTGRAGAVELVPPGYGTLTQAQFTLELASGTLQIQVTPLAESVIRLLLADQGRTHAATG